MMKVSHVVLKNGTVNLIVTTDDERIVLSEDDWDQLETARAEIMRPITERRWEERKRVAAAEEDRKRRAAQHVIDIDGVKVRIQRNWADSGMVGVGGYIGAWLDGYEPEVAPFYVARLGFSSLRPWGITAKIKRRRADGWPIRDEVFSDKGASFRFASAEMAVRKALALGLHKVEEAVAP